MKRIFAANWKMFKGPKEARDFFLEWKKLAPKISGQLIFFPPAMALPEVSTHTPFFGLQNIYCKGEGAFTGENSAEVAKSLGATHVLIGHSERRKIFGEGDELLAQKVEYAQSLGLIPVFCIGETLQERESGQTQRVNEAQLRAGLIRVDKTKEIIIAYEPVWAIGTGVVASLEQVRETHGQIREYLNSQGLSQAPLLYGGSVKPDNSKSLLTVPHVDGFLVGGASLTPPSFAALSAD